MSITTAAEYLAIAAAARESRAIVRTYSQPMDEALRALVLEREGAEGLERLEVASAAYLAQQVALLEQADADMDEWLANKCTRCSGTGDYHGPTSHYRKGRPVCFQCGGSGQRKG